MLSVLARIPLFRLYRRFGWPQLLPINLTISPSPRCNSRCKTCNIWKKREDELRLDEWEKVLRSLGHAPYWFTISGGEPFLYRHVVELAHMVYRHTRPGIINIPTNGILSDIPTKVQRIAEGCPRSQVIINLSLDGVGEKHDEIRGVPGNFAKFERTLRALLALREGLPNLTVGIHSVISVFSIGHLESLLAYAAQSGADQYITEIAEQRPELDTVGLPITPSAEAYAQAVERLIAYVEAHEYQGIARITEAFRVEYYKLARRIITDQEQSIPCYAGWASAHIYADGTVWPCCVRADPLGNLRQHGYDFKEIWFGEAIQSVRRSSAAKECHCPLANAAYTNMLHHIPTLSRVGAKVALGNSLPIVSTNAHAKTAD
ncbi:MAG: radical SAM protein [Anaerolineae bacterium]|nr:MAG: radical SAM protein [Anaerolineae bacterium]